MRKRLSSLLIITLAVLIADVLVAAAWFAGSWISGYMPLTLSWVLGVLILFLLPFTVALTGYAFLGFREGLEPVPATVLCVILLLSSVGTARSVTHHEICASRFSQAGQDAEKCDFLCFDEMYVYESAAVEYTTTRVSRTGGTRKVFHRYVPAGGFLDSGPYTVFLDSNGEKEGRCIWQESYLSPFERSPLEYVRDSSTAYPSAIIGDRVADPEAALFRYRWWVAFFAVVCNVLALAGGVLIAWRGQAALDEVMQGYRPPWS